MIFTTASKLWLNPRHGALPGQEIGDIQPGPRRANQGSHAIYFKQTDGGILILRILHQRMDPARHFADLGNP